MLRSIRFTKETLILRKPGGQSIAFLRRQIVSVRVVKFYHLWLVIDTTAGKRVFHVCRGNMSLFLRGKLERWLEDSSSASDTGDEYAVTSDSPMQTFKERKSPIL